MLSLTERHNTRCQSCLGFSTKQSYFSFRVLLFVLTRNLDPDDDEGVAVAATESGYITLRPRGESVAQQVNYSGDEM